MPFLIVPALVFVTGLFVGSQVDDAVDTNLYNPQNSSTPDIFSTGFLIKIALASGAALLANKVYKKLV